MKTVKIIERIIDVLILALAVFTLIDMDHEATKEGVNQVAKVLTIYFTIWALLKLGITLIILDKEE